MFEGRFFRTIWLSLVLMIILLGRTFAAAQSKQSTTKLDPYRNFVGTWSGTYVQYPEGKAIDVVITISEEKHGKRMRWDYVLGMKGDKGYGRDTKFVRLDIPKQRMELEWKGNDAQIYKTTGLETFAAEGFGSFKITGYFS